VVRAFYGKPAGKNYFIACSAGGHHALMEATRFPADYDGFVAGAAPWKWTSLMFGHTWNARPVLQDPGAVTAESLAILGRRMMAACDKLDGVEDGIMADPRRCTVDPGQFQCGQTRTADCLTQVQVKAARHIYAGAKRSDGTVLMPGQVRGGEPGWLAYMGMPTPGGSSAEFWKLTVFQDESFKNVNFDFDKDTDRALATKVGGHTLAEVYDQKSGLRPLQGTRRQVHPLSGLGRSGDHPDDGCGFLHPHRRPLWPEGDGRLLPFLPAGRHGSLQRRRRLLPYRRRDRRTDSR